MTPLAESLRWHPRRRAIAAALTALLPLRLAAQAPDATIVVTGNPLGRDSLAQPLASLAGEGLLLRRATTLGETLSGLAGVAASGFGPNASRPVIRGLDGDRVRLLDNGGAAVDASNLSFDHAVAQDPLVAERIELLRGPAALLYGGNATGGVVNSIDNRVPRAPQPGLASRSELRLGGAASTRSAAAVLDGGEGALAWHVDAFGRRSDDLRVPAHVAPDDGGHGTVVSDRVRNSAARAEGGALGASWADADGHLGLAVDGVRQRYGVTVEPDVSIQLRRERVQLGGERRRLPGPFEQLAFSASTTRYRHLEVEGDGEVGTRFASRGQEWRLQARQRPLGAWQGVLGVQAERLDFSARGAEAFVPATQTHSLALFTLQEADLGAWRLQAGARTERVRVASDGDGDADAASPRFGQAAVRRFAPASASLGATWQPAPGWALGVTLGHTERAPAYYELFANGLHLASAAFERGDADLGTERSRHAGATLEWRAGPQRAKLSVYQTRFSRYLALSASGRELSTAAGETLPEYRFEAVPARLAGFEVETRWRLLERPWRLDLSADADAVRGTDLARGQPLPRIAPRSLQLGLDLGAGPWAAGMGLRHAARQDRVPATDQPTPGYTMLNLWARWRLPVGAAAATAFVRLDNATDRLAYNAVAVPTIRALAPLGGRALTAGVQMRL